jgi:hypothetical protein
MVSRVCYGNTRATRRNIPDDGILHVFENITIHAVPSALRLGLFTGPYRHVALAPCMARILSLLLLLLLLISSPS